MHSHVSRLFAFQSAREVLCATSLFRDYRMRTGCIHTPGANTITQMHTRTRRRAKESLDIHTYSQRQPFKDTQPHTSARVYTQRHILIHTHRHTDTHIHIHPHVHVHSWRMRSQPYRASLGHFRRSIPSGLLRRSPDSTRKSFRHLRKRRQRRSSAIMYAKRTFVARAHPPHKYKIVQ